MDQLSIDFNSAARAGRDAGMAAAIAHAEHLAEGWGERAYAALIQFARHRQSFTSYDFRQAVGALGLDRPPTDKAYGSVFLRAARVGVIRKNGYVPHPERHASPTPIWEVV